MRYIWLFFLTFTLISCASTSLKQGELSRHELSNKIESMPVPYDEWHCTEVYKNKVLVVLKGYDESEEMEGFGELRNAEVEAFEFIWQGAVHDKGLKQIWFFGADFKQQIHLKVNGRAHYYDFSSAAQGEEVMSDLTLQCEKE